MKNEIPNSQRTPGNRREKSYSREDEINLVDFLRTILRRKYFILSCSILPALLLGIILFITPKDCKVTYTYDIKQDKRDLKMLLDKLDNVENLNYLITQLEIDEPSDKYRKILLESFFDSENLDRLTTRLRENGFDEYAQRISRTNIQTEISATLLTITINGKSGEDMKKISSIVRDNFETNLLIYAAKQELSSNISILKNRIAEIEENKFSTELEIKSQKTLLTKLKNIASADSNNIRDNLVLHFDNPDANKAYLPWEYQARAAQANIIYIEQTIIINREKNSRYKALVDLDEKLLNDIIKSTSSLDNVQEFRSFLSNITDGYQDTEFNDYINSYINKIENAISAYTPLIENPDINFIPKNIIKKSAIVFLTFLIISMFLAFLLGAVQKNRKSAS